MKEALMQLHGNVCTVNMRGRVIVKDPSFTVTISQLRVLSLISLGKEIKKIARQLNTTPRTISTLTANLRRENNHTTMTNLIGIATRLDLLNPFAIEGVMTKKAQLIKEKPINVTKEFQAIKVNVEI